jgi:uncharacterized protein DUF4953
MSNNKRISRGARFAVAAVLAGVVAGGCVKSRPTRNGVFNENHYLRKAFIIREGTADQPDPGWFLKVTVTKVSTPNPLGSGIFFMTPGADNEGALVRFRVAENKLEMLSQREITKVPSELRTDNVVNAWPATNVDIKYRINLDGEITNFLEENQELNWQDRQWVKLAFEKNDFSDLLPLSSFQAQVVAFCADSANISATVVPDSFNVDEDNNYMEWTVALTFQLNLLDPACRLAYASSLAAFEGLMRDTVTINLKYSMRRADQSPSYQPLVVAEKDAIRHKYGFFETIAINRDEDSGQVAGTSLVNRFDPEKPIVWYFTKDFPAEYKKFFTDPNGIADQTNKIFEDVGAKARVSFKEYDQDLAEGEHPREYGDIRYNFINWISDRDTQDAFAGLESPVIDPRTGEMIGSTVTLSDFAIKDYYVQRIDSFLASIGASQGVNTPGMWDTPKDVDGSTLDNCQDGDTVPLIPDVVRMQHNKQSSLYGKMQFYLNRPVEQYGPLGPQNFIIPHDDDNNDFYRAYFAIIPYQVFADPTVNPYVIPEGGQGVFGPGDIFERLKKEDEFHKLAAKIDHGEAPYELTTGNQGVTNIANFLKQWKDYTLSHKNFVYAKQFINHAQHMDSANAFSFETVIARDARHCRNGHWETKEEWIASLINTYWSQVAWHEFGHAMGLAHNFMASVDKPNYPMYTDGAGRKRFALYASSVMEYNGAPDRIFWTPGWAPYDRGAIAWLFSNTKPNGMPGTSITGQASPTAPWNDKFGFDDQGAERVFLYCSHQHLQYTPLCRQGDLGATPSEIMANEIEGYEWQYQWRNFRQYRKFWDDSAYVDTPANIVVDMRRFLSMWEYDWSGSELADTFRRIGITNPNPNGSNLEYYTQLTNKFNQELSATNQMVGAFHEAIIQQSSGERPYRTTYDRYFGDVTQQGIILDKLFATQGWVALWPSVNYDPNQSGAYFASWAGLGDASFNYVAQNALTSMIGGQYDVYPYFVPFAVAQFAQDSHDPSLFGRVDVRDWIGGHVFYRLQDFLDYFRDVAVQNNVCTDVASCTYDPRGLSDMHNEFIGPDQRRWIWAYVMDRNQWVAVQRDRNTASYVIVRNYTDDVIYQMDDGAFPGGAYSAELPMKYFLDSFNFFN